MAKGKKPGFPSKTCPQCGDYIHARSQKHEKCGWVMEASAKPAKKTKGRRGRPRGSGKGAPVGASISLADIQAVKAITDRIGAARVKELADLLA